MKKHVLIILMALAAGATEAALLASYNFYGSPSVPPITAGGGQVYSTNLSVSLSRGPGINSANASNNWIASGWTKTDQSLTGAVASNDYFQGSISASGGTISVTNIQFMARLANSAAPTSIVIRISTNADFSSYTDSAQVNRTNTAVYSNPELSSFSFDSNNSGSAVYFRIYAFGANVTANTVSFGFGGGLTGNPATDGGISGFGDNLQDLIIQGEDASTGGGTGGEGGGGTGGGTSNTVKKARVYIFSGQSNMTGLGRAADLADPSLVSVQTNIWFDMVNPPDFFAGLAPTNWGPLQMLNSQFGPEFGFSRTAAANFPDRQIVIVKVYKSATASAYWSPGPRENMTSTLHYGYWALMDRLDEITARLNSQVASNQISGYEWGGFVWMQGEGDADGTIKGSGAYTTNTLGLFRDVRAKVGVTNLPIVLGRISFQLDPSVIRPTGMDRAVEKTQGDYLDHELRGPVAWSVQLASIRTAQVAFAASGSNIEWVNTDDLPLLDYWHFNGAGQYTLGERMAMAIPEGVQDDDGDGMGDAYETANGLSKTNSADAALDGDGDGVSNLHEFLAGTSATNAQDRFTISPWNRTAPGLFDISGRAGHKYSLWRADSLDGTWTQLSETAVIDTNGMFQISDPAPGTNSSCFYRLKARLP